MDPLRADLTPAAASLPLSAVRENDDGERLLASQPLAPSADAAHIDNPTIPLPNRDLKASAASRCPIDEEPATAIYPAHITETATAKQPFALTAGYSSASIEYGADVNIDADVGLGARRDWSRYRCYQQSDSEPQRQQRTSEHDGGPPGYEKSQQRAHRLMTLGACRGQPISAANKAEREAASGSGRPRKSRARPSVGNTDRRADSHVLEPPGGAPWVPSLPPLRRARNTHWRTPLS